VSQWTMQLIPTTRSSSLSHCNQLAYQFRHDGETTPSSMYPPMLSVGDMVRFAMSFDNASFPDGKTLPSGTTAKMSVLSTSLEAPFAPLPYKVDLVVDPNAQTELYSQQTITSATDSFRFRLAVEVIEPGDPPVTTTYTVDPEMAVGDN